ncbi:hypothetical protein LUPAC07_00213 [Micromonospora noduli]|nr:hypothetical protein LUPAC07_00213 [Micromonospora noduli]
MAITLVNPDGLPKPDVYRQLSIATGSRLVFLAGQVARDVEGRKSARETSPPRSSSAISTLAPPWPRSVGPSATWRN